MPIQARDQRAPDDRSQDNLEQDIIGRSPAIHQLRERVHALADLQVPVLIRGEPGTGRRHTARALHSRCQSQHLDLVFVGANGSRPPSISPRKCFVLLDVDSHPRAEQARWADLLKRAGSDYPDAPGRLIATTSQLLPDISDSGDFYPELARKLGRFTLDLPPLRDRREDIAPLAHALTDRAATQLRGVSVRLTAGAVTLLAGQTWPGNVHDLADVIERLVAFCRGSRITRDQVRSLLNDNPKGVVSSRRLQVQRQREELAELITETGGNLAEVARRLDMSRGGVIYRAQKFGLLPNRR
jgi:DNA-binding NtrC family response regulator